MVQMCADHAKASGESPAISSATDQYSSMLDEGTRAQLRQKFEECYKSILFATLLVLEARHGVDLGSAYGTPDSARIFTLASLLQVSTPGLCQHTLQL